MNPPVALAKLAAVAGMTDRLNRTGLCSPISTPNSSLLVRSHFGDQHLDCDLERDGVELFDDRDQRRPTPPAWR